MFQSSLLSFSLFLLLFFFCFSFSLGLCHLLLSSSCPPFFSFLLSFFPSVHPSSRPSFLPALSAHSSATIEAIEAIEVKDAEGKTLTHLTVRACTRVCLRVCVCVCVSSMAALSAAHAHEVTLSSQPTTHQALPLFQHQHQHTWSLFASPLETGRALHTRHNHLHHSHHLHTVYTSTSTPHTSRHLRATPTRTARQKDVGGAWEARVLFK